MFFKDWNSLLRVLIVGVSAYAALILLLRLSGKRTLAQMNAFDFVVTVALGSTLATVLLSKDVALLEGIFAFALLIFLQLAVAWLSVRSSIFSRIVKSEPRLLFHRGRFLETALRKERIKKEELLQAVRNQGIASLDQVEAVILETNGRLSTLKISEGRTASALSNIDGIPDKGVEQ